uniref:Uncharacterized protein n=1 Tax=Anolis carolinensis TaxID=28377 RepID=H9GKF9_ANOCA
CVLECIPCGYRSYTVQQCVEEGPLLSPGDLCPSGWIEFQRKCYYFSEDEGNWASSSLYCSSHNASLAVIDSQEEMVSSGDETHSSSLGDP